METLVKKEANCYFLCKINESQIEFKGFNDESIKFDEFDSSRTKLFNNNQIYFFQRLEIEGNTCLFIKNKSTFAKSNGINLTDEIKIFNSLEPYSFIGKVIKKEEKQFIFLTSVNKIVILTNIENKLKDIKENQFIQVSFIKFYTEKDGIIYFQIHPFSSFKILDNIEEENQINQKIALKFNLIDFNEFLDNNDIIITNLGIKLNSNKIIKLKIDKKIIYFIYDASQIEYEYFPQKIKLYDIDDSYINFKFFVYKSFLNEINLFVKQKSECSYEFLYFSLDNSLPKEIKINYQKEKTFTSSNFHTFNSKIRKSIIFVNIPPQKINDTKNGTNLLNIYLCKKDNTKLYGTFSLDTIKLKPIIKPYEYNPIVIDKLNNIYNDYIQCFEKNFNFKQFEKYILFDENENQILKNTLKEAFLHRHKYENSKKTLDYFHSLCLWNLYYFIKISENTSSIMKEYIEVYNKIINRNNLNYVEKSMILIGFMERAFEDIYNFSCPKFYFYNELNDMNPYKLAYNFQFEIIENITEDSCLFQPFLFLDSYIMKCSYKKKSFEFIESTMPAYSISMLPIELIKNHLRKSIKNYFFVLEKENGQNKRKYNASVQRFNNVVTYNENILLRNYNFKKMYDIDKVYALENEKIVKNYTFNVNLENLHENFAHNKEEIVNMEKSPSLYFDRNFEYSYIYDYNDKEHGEAGKLVETFIAEVFYIEAMKSNRVGMGEYIKVEYFVDRSFQNLIDGFKNIIELKNQNEEKEKIKKKDYESFSINTDSKNYNVQKENIKEDKKNNILCKEDSLLNIKELLKKEEININNSEDKGIILPKSNTLILSANSMEELMEKVKELDSKKFIVREDAIESNNDICNY